MLQLSLPTTAANFILKFSPLDQFEVYSLLPSEIT